MISGVMSDTWALHGSTVGRWVNRMGGRRLLALLRAVTWPLMRFADRMIFVVAPAVGVPVAILNESEGVDARVALAGVAGTLALIGAWSHWIEPRWIDLTRLAFRCPGLRSRVRVVWLTDLQTDAPGGYERRVLALARAQRPDLMLLGGDYLHTESLSQTRALEPALRRILAAELPATRFGTYAVNGNTDRTGWERLFLGTGVRAVSRSRSVDLGPLRLSLLSFRDSLRRAPRIAKSRKYHLVAGHSPNFSMGSRHGDLLLAGHTHGGQVRLPWIGPLVTMSLVPRAWAAGETDLGNGRRLVVSRGIGMDRRGAPRVRFLCRPELAVLDLIPAGSRRA